ncbi:MAG: phosphatase PAP2 family protein [Thaumarchaeota archaeon]|nr:phosphatase PAP2 family protein [Nitrososphaerota archaeon]
MVLKNKELLLVGVVSTALFLLIAFLVFSGITQSIDSALALWMNAGLGETFTRTMVLASAYGREYFWIAIVALMLVFGDTKTRILAVELAALFAIGIAVGEVLKFTVYRARPYETVLGIHLRVPGDSDSSFPSGHALIVSIGSIFVLLRFKHKLIACLLTLEAAIVCFSRVYVGMHYPLDVIAGIFIGAAIVFFGLFVVENFLPRLVSSIAGLFDRAFNALGVKGITFTMSRFIGKIRPLRRVLTGR